MMVKLDSTTQKFIIHWGEMGSRWGINRTVAQIHALLYISSKPLTAEEISDTLGVARSTVSTGLRELQSWGIVKITHVLGDRRDYFEVIGDVWEMFRVVLSERKHRELDPALDVLRETVIELEQGSENDLATQEKMSEMLDVFETVSKLYEQVDKLSTQTLVKIAKSGDVVGRVLNLASGSKVVSDEI
jgi:DNA-binding transcriptional regulator GbsR (MarR family)